MGPSVAASTGGQGPDGSVLLVPTGRGSRPIHADRESVASPSVSDPSSTVHRWAIEQVVALATTSARFGAGEALAVPSRWSPTGCGRRAVWGRYHGSGAEPYDVAVDHVDVRSRCTCPSRVRPCKHAIGLLVLWVRGQVPAGSEPDVIAGWVDQHQRPVPDSIPPSPAAAVSAEAGTGTDDDAAASPDVAPGVDGADGADGVEARNERVERLVGGLVELDRWLEDRLRLGLADPSVTRFATWDAVARRLTDARAGALANRLRRLAGRVGASPEWHEAVLAEIGVLHLLAQAGQRVPSLPTQLADGVAVACGWQVRKADVEASTPETDRWLVAGRSDTREDLIEVRRVWLCGERTGAWALLLSFAAYQQPLDASCTVGGVLDADVHRYPGSAQRALLGTIHDVRPSAAVGSAAALALAVDTAEACSRVGRVLAAEPWLDRVPVVMQAAITRSDGRWVLTDQRGSLVIAAEATAGDAVATVLAATSGGPATMTLEWTPHGFVPLTVFLPDRSIDVGPRADPSFVSAA